MQSKLERSPEVKLRAGAAVPGFFPLCPSGKRTAWLDSGWPVVKLQAAMRDKREVKDKLCRGSCESLHMGGDMGAVF